MAQKLAGLNPGLGQLAPGKLCQPSSKWVPFLNKRLIMQRKEREGLLISYHVPKIQQALWLLGYG